ncbi:MAG: Na+/H+ antiporter NhaC family protein [Lachnospiraceae bacterium]|nr:Na+/H+ antiporter NhaC family protein [Lachnospiraceae bacterium]
MNEKKGSFIGLLPMIIFLIVYFAFGIGTGEFDASFPLMMGITLASIISLLIESPAVEKKKTFAEKAIDFCKGGGDDTLILMVLIFLLAGAFYKISIETGARDVIGRIGVALLPPRFILPAIFIIGMVFSFAMGTSMGTVNAVMVFATGFAETLNVPMPLICGVVVGGAMFGDNLSFISDTTIAATTTQEVPMKAKFQQNILMCLPAVIITLIALCFVPITVPEATTLPAINEMLCVVPFILIIILALAGVHVLISMTLSVAVGAVIGVIQGNFPLFNTAEAAGVFAQIHEGMTWMEDIGVIAILIGGVCAMMHYLGGIQWLMNTLAGSVKSSKGCELALAALAFLVDIATTNNTVTIIAIGPIAKELADKFGVARERVASILDIFASVGQGISPHGGQLLTAGRLAGISPAAMIPFCWYPILMGVSSLVFILLGIANPTHKKVAA